MVVHGAKAGVRGGDSEGEGKWTDNIRELGSGGRQS